AQNKLLYMCGLTQFDIDIVQAFSNGRTPGIDGLECSDLHEVFFQSCWRLDVLMLLAGCCILSQGSLARQDPLELRIKSGVVRGKIVSLPDNRGEAFAFLGIPFAEPPVENLRFREPVPISKWSGVYDATNFGNSCMQKLDMLYPDFPGAEMWNPNTQVSEDCLYLNVWTPSPKPHKAAVMVGNYGMYDQVLALKWMKSNIGTFGGDPNRVTIFGESTGAASVGLHLLSPLSEPLFNRAILQSGTPDAEWAVMTHGGAETKSQILGSFHGCNFSQSDFVDCLRNVSADELSARERQFSEMPWTPIADGKYLLYDPKHSDEGRYFILYGFVPGYEKDSTNLQTYENYLANVDYTNSDLNTCSRAAIKDHYTHWESPHDAVVNRDNLGDVIDDRLLICPTVNFAHKYAQTNVNVYSYQYNIRDSQNPWPEWMAVIHGDEIQFVFGIPLNPANEFTEKEVRYSEKIMAYWTNFAKSGVT
uniref:Carboxylic ester hydrolase n=1 Tax=Saccoglossus kowalevskii TaxID=10224 RepID=A0ABM0MWI9_SACKO